MTPRYLGRAPLCVTRLRPGTCAQCRISCTRHSACGAQGSSFAAIRCALVSDAASRRVAGEMGQWDGGSCEALQVTDHYTSGGELLDVSPTRFTFCPTEFQPPSHVRLQLHCCLATCDRRWATERVITMRVRGHELHNSPQPDVLGLIGNITCRFPRWEIIALQRTIA